MPLSSSYPQRRHPRLGGYDYASPGFYFVTVCTRDRLPLFGSVVAGTMRLSPAGELVQEAWQSLVAVHAGIEVDTAVTMPDHVHAIVVLEDDPYRVLDLSAVLQRYKAMTTRRYAHGVRDQGWPRFSGTLWQASFHDRVIRDEKELDAVRRYILENPFRWELRQNAGEPSPE